MTQSDLGEQIGKTSAVVGSYENGVNQPPLDTLIALTNFFQVNVDDLIFKDLSKNAASPFEKKETSVNEQLLIDLLQKRVRQLEEEFKELDPERAKRLGID